MNRMFASERAAMEQRAALREALGAEMCAWLDKNFAATRGDTAHGWSAVVQATPQQVTLSVTGSKGMVTKIMSVKETQFTRSGERRISPPDGWAVASSRRSSGRGKCSVVLQRVVHQ